MTDKTELPLNNAEVSIPRLSLSTHSDSAGNFLIDGVISGTHEVLIRLNGFEPLRESFNFSVGEKIAVDFLLSERIIMPGRKNAAAKAAESPNLGRAMLEDRRGTGGGRYITTEEFAKVFDKTTADVITDKIPGLRANKISGRARALAFNDPEHRVEPSDADKKMGAKADCYVQVLLNGTLMYQNGNGNTLFDVNSIPREMILSADFFSYAQTPPENQTPGARCGTMQITTRGR